MITVTAAIDACRPPFWRRREKKDRKEESRDFLFVKGEAKYLGKGKRIQGYPFSKGFPINHYGKTYGIITAEGKRLSAKVDVTNESLMWETASGELIDESQIAGWREE